MQYRNNYKLCVVLVLIWTFYRHVLSIYVNVPVTALHELRNLRMRYLFLKIRNLKHLIALFGGGGVFLVSLEQQPQHGGKIPASGSQLINIYSFLRMFLRCETPLTLTSRSIDIRQNICRFLSHPCRSR